MRYLSMHHEHVRSQGRALPLRATGHAILRTLAAWRDRSRQRRVLAELDERMLRDIGVTRADIAWEVNKSFWQR